MRAGLSTIQQTLTPEAASVLNHSIGEAARRNHGQTTPLHVAATLLAAPSGFLRQACIRSHPNSSHPLQCRALELCFSIALDRLPSTTTTTATGSTASAAVAEPPISNALMAALKRAQAHQRRGCPEQQQQPLLAVKVELEQLIVSILDDPSVSRVMREASFSSPAVKATIEQSLTAASSGQKSPSPTASATVSGGLGLGLGLGYRPPSRNLYMNPRLHQQQQQNQQPGIGGVAACGGDRREEVKRVVDILMRPRKRNPVLVGDSDPDAVMKEVLQRIENGDAPLRTAKVISLEKEFASDRSQIPSKIKELGSLIETQISTSGGGVILDLGDLKWLVESPGGFGTSTGSVPTQQQQQIVSETGRAAVAEMGKLLGRFGEGGVGSRVWLVGTATCATYLRCQVYHPTMENDWDLQAVPIAPRSPMPNMFPRLGGNGILSSSVETLTPLKGSSAMSATPIPLRPPSESPNPSRRTTLCLLCMENYERELAKLVAKEFEKSSSDSKPEAQQTLPQWLQIAKLSNGGSKSNTDQLQTKEQELMWKQSTEELLKRWRETCSRLHPNFHPAIVPERPMAPALSMPSAFSPTTLPRQTLQSKLQLPRNMPTLQMSNHHGPVLNSSSDRPSTPPGSPVKTDLVLGHSKVSGTLLEETHRERVKDFAGCKLDRFSDQQGDKIAGISDIASFKKLFKGLIDKVGWQPEAANVITNVVLQCKSGNGKRRGTGPKGDTWLLFIGHDKVGKKKMASALSELVFGTSPITVRLAGPRADGDDGESDVNFRGKTSLDRVAEAVRQNPFSVVVLEDVDRADALVQGTIKRAMERGRLPDSHGREVALGSVIFVLTADWLPENLKNSQNSVLESEEKILALANCGWQLELSVGESAGKRRADWLCEGGDRPIRPRMESAAVSGLSFDLNLTAGADEDTAEGSRNSSDLTVEHEHEFGRLAIKRAASSSASELIDSADESIMFKPVDFGPLRRKISESISTKFTSIMGNGRLIRIDEDTLDRMVGGIWLGGSTARFEGWTETVLVPSIQELKSSNSKGGDGVAVRLSSMPIKGCRMERNGGDWFPCKVNITVDGV